MLPVFMVQQFQIQKSFCGKSRHRPNRLGLKPKANSENPLKRVKPDF
jgi:hypothetical protein